MTGRALHFVLLLLLLLTLCLLAISEAWPQSPGPPTYYVLGPAPPKPPPALEEMVEPPPATEAQLQTELQEPVYMLGELLLELPIAPLTDGDPIEPLPQLVIRPVTYLRNCWHVRDRHHRLGRVECSEPYPQE